MNAILTFIGLLVLVVVLAISSAIGDSVGREIAENAVTARANTPTSAAPSVTSHTASTEAPAPISSDDEIESALRYASNKVNASLPKVIDVDTRLDNVLAGPGRKWTYHYTLVSDGTQNANQQQLQDALGTSIKNGVCTAQEMKVFVENGVQVVYRYRSRDGQFVGDIVVNPTDCQ